jgi:nitrogen fixation protein FixH
MSRTDPTTNGRRRAGIPDVPPRGFLASGRAWPLGIAAVLVGTMGINFWVLKIAGSDPSFAVERDYYRKGIGFDQQVERDRASRALGWTIAPVVASRGAEGGATLAVRLADRAGAPIGDARVVVQAFAVARSADVRIDTLVATGEGRYAARAPRAPAGLWELRFDVARGDERFASVARVEVPPATPSGRAR